MKALLYALALLAGGGVGLSLIVHLAAWSGLELSRVETALHIGVFAVWLPAVFAGLRLVLASTARGSWKPIISGAPRWMLACTVCLIGYAMLNFVFVRAFLPDEGPSAEVNALRAFSGHWMAFYSAALVIFSSALQAMKPTSRRIAA